MEKQDLLTDEDACFMIFWVHFKRKYPTIPTDQDSIEIIKDIYVSGYKAGQDMYESKVINLLGDDFYL